MSSVIDDIKSKLNVEDVVGGYIRLDKAGNNYKARCPFHSEKSPSFMVSPDRQIWHCFGCGKGGSIFDFVMEIEGLEFGEALKMLAQRAGVELEKINPKISQKWKTEKTKIYEVCALATKFFIKQMESGREGQKLSNYLKERKMSQSTILDWQVGYAPASWQSLLDFLKTKGYSEKDAVKAGLAIEKDTGTAYDRFRDRIMFPIRDLTGSVVGFSGRENPYRPDQRMGKYINTPNTLIYDKSRILFGLDKARMQIKQKNSCILVEGQMDVIMSHQEGFDNAVAASGTSLTLEQLKLIKRYTNKLLTAFDMDPAGETATKRSISLAIETGLDTRVIVLKKDKDPADYLMENPKLWSKAIKKAQTVIDFYIQNAVSKNNPGSAQGKKRIAEEVLPVIKKISSRVEQSHWIQELADIIGGKEEDLNAEMKLIKDLDYRRSTFEKKDDETDNKNKLPENKLEEYFLGLGLIHPKEFKRHCPKSEKVFFNEELKEIFKHFKNQKKLSCDKIKTQLPKHLVHRIDYLAFKAENQKQLANKFEPEKEIKFCASQINKKYLKYKLDQINLAIKNAEKTGNKETLKKLSQKFNKFTIKLNNNP